MVLRQYPYSEVLDMRFRLVAVMLFVVAGGIQFSALGVVATPEEAQKQWKALAKEELAAFKTQVKVVLGDFKADVAQYKVEVATLVKNPILSCQDIGNIYGTAYSGLQAQIEASITQLEVDGTNLLFALGTDLVAGFENGDGGTLDKTMVSLLKEVDKFDKTLRKAAPALKKAVEKNDGSADVQFTFVFYRVPLGFAPTPRNAAIPALEGIRNNAPLCNFMTLNRGTNFAFLHSCGLTLAATLNYQYLKDGAAPFSAFGFTPDANGVYSFTGGVGVAPGNYHILFKDAAAATVSQWSSFIGAGP